jgi:hypothetical protein
MHKAEIKSYVVNNQSDGDYSSINSVNGCIKNGRFDDMMVWSGQRLVMLKISID